MTHPFKVYKSVAFSVVTKLCNHHHNQFENFLHTTKIPVPIKYASLRKKLQRKKPIVWLCIWVNYIYIYF